jgi:hypothetical protein
LGNQQRRLRARIGRLAALDPELPLNMDVMKGGTREKAVFTVAAPRDRCAQKQP